MLRLLDLNPLLALDRWLSILRYGRGVRFVVRSATAVQIALRTLKRYGVRTYAYSFAGDGGRAFRVRREQAQWAEYLLLRAGVPMLLRPHHPDNVGVKAGKMPEAWADKDPKAAARSVGFAGMVIDFLSRF